MLTGYQCETIAYLGDGEIICRECAIAETSALTIEKVDMGLSNSSDLRPLSRHSVDESSSEQTWGYAAQLVREFNEKYPGFRLTPTHEDRLTARWADRHPVNETCGACGEEIV